MKSMVIINYVDLEMAAEEVLGHRKVVHEEFPTIRGGGVGGVCPPVMFN